MLLGAARATRLVARARRRRCRMGTDGARAGARSRLPLRGDRALASRPRSRRERTTCASTSPTATETEAAVLDEIAALASSGEPDLRLGNRHAHAAPACRHLGSASATSSPSSTRTRTTPAAALAGRPVLAPRELRAVDAPILVSSAVSQSGIAAAARERFGPRRAAHPAVLGWPMSLARRYAGRRVFVTGHTGFKGAWLAEWLADARRRRHRLRARPADPAEPVRRARPRRAACGTSSPTSAIATAWWPRCRPRGRR